MSSLRSIDLSLIDEILRGGEKGYILDFSNRTFGDFFNRELGIDIDAPAYATDGTSKAKRLGCFLKKVDDGTAARALRALWEHREVLRPAGEADRFPRAAAQFAALVARLDGGGPTAPSNVVAAPALDAIEFDRFRMRLLAIRDLPPQQRGYDFEQFLKDLFDAFRMSAREPFRLLGEQIDGTLSSLARPTSSRRSGSTAGSAWLNSARSTQNSSRRHTGLVGCSSASAVTLTKACTASDAVAASSQWTGGIYTTRSCAVSRSTGSYR